MNKASSSQTKKHRSKKEQAKIMASIREMIGQNLSDEEIKETLGLSHTRYTKYKTHIQQTDAMKVESITSVSAFSDYILKMNQIVRELDEAKEICKERGQGQALVNAIWKKKEAFDSILKWGQDFGFIDKRSSELKISSEFSFATMTDAEVKEEIDRELEKLKMLSQPQIAMRPEVAEFIEPQVMKHIPANVITLPPQKKKAKTRPKRNLINRSQ